VQFLLGNIIQILINITHVGDRLHPIVKVFLPVSDYLIKNFDGEVSDHFSSLCIGVDVLLDESSVVVSCEKYIAELIEVLVGQRIHKDYIIKPIFGALVVLKDSKMSKFLYSICEFIPIKCN
jgi:hypothetical protein